MRSLVFVLLCLCTFVSFTQERTNVVYIHSHNDYLQDKPLLSALNAKANSIEIDVFLQNKQLFVAHTKTEIVKDNTLENLYLLPLQRYLNENTIRHNFHLMIDIKSETLSTLNKIQLILKKYPEVLAKDGVKVIISGNRPSPKTYNDYADFIYFDGRSPRDARGHGGERVAMISQNLSKFTHWRGDGEISIADKNKLKQFIEDCHQQNKHVRLWNTGDTKIMYRFLYDMGVDYINTDSPQSLRNFLNQNKLKTNNY